jgi:hypothetical protein
MITVDLRQMSNRQLCKDEDSWFPAMQSEDHLGGDRADVQIFRGRGAAGIRVGL